MVTKKKRRCINELKEVETKINEKQDGNLLDDECNALCKKRAELTEKGIFGPRFVGEFLPKKVLNTSII